MNTNILPSKAYDILKWVVLVFLPALTTLVGVVGQVLNLASMEIVLTIMVAVTTFLCVAHPEQSAQIGRAHV